MGDDDRWEVLIRSFFLGCARSVLRAYLDGAAEYDAVTLVCDFQSWLAAQGQP